jgi:hypothetical protein
MPIRRARPLDRLRWTPVVVGVATSAVLAVTVVPWALSSDRQPALIAFGGAQNGQPNADKPRGVTVPGDVDWEAVDRDVGGRGSCPATDVSQCVVVRGSGPHVTVIGDSQAQMLVPMFTSLAKEHDLTLSLNVEAGCMWQENLTNAEASPAGQRRCAAARVGWYDQALPKLDPDVVILVQRARDDPKLWSGTVTGSGGSADPLEQITLTATEETIAKITATTPHTLIVANLIMPNTFDPADCLASLRDPERCAVWEPTAPAPSDGLYATISAHSALIDTVNLNPAFCPSAPICLPVVDGSVVWRDDHHYTASYANQRRDRVWRQLMQTGVLQTAGS